MESNPTIYIGIDPGVSGAIAAIYPDSSPSVWDAPTIRVPVGGKSRRELVPNEMATMIRQLVSGHRVLAFIEWAQAMPGQGVTSMFSYGQGFGLWLGVLAGYGVATTRVR